MKILVADKYETLSNQLADDLIHCLQKKTTPLLCVASGDSPAGLYREIVKRVQQKNLDISGWYFVGLDEWVGMNGTDEGSCRFHLDQELFHLLEIPENRICFFDGRTQDLTAECSRMESFIHDRGGIDAVVAGLGINGHVGLNEPGTFPELRAHVTKLHPVTKKVGQKYFKQEQQLTKGITLGIANLLESDYIFFVVSGRHKADIVQKMLEGPVSETVPASLLRPHSGLLLYVDKEAASMIQTENYAS